MTKKAMTKKDIVRVISEELGLTQKQTKEVVQRTFNSIIETLVSEGRIELRNFGVFEVKSRAARTARNPKTGKQVEVPEKFVVTFKPGKVMENRVGELTDQPERPDWLDQTLPDDASTKRPTLQSDTKSQPNSSSQTTQSNPDASTAETNRDDLPLRPTGRWD